MKHNLDMGNALIDSVDLAEESKISEFKDKIFQILDYKINQVSEEIELTEDEIEELSEAAKIVVKVNSKGQRRRKMICGHGKKLVNGACVIQSSTEKLNTKRGRIKARKTKKAKGAGFLARTNRLRNKAMKKRSQQGL